MWMAIYILQKTEYYMYEIGASKEEGLLEVYLNKHIGSVWIGRGGSTSAVAIFLLGGQSQRK